MQFQSLLPLPFLRLKYFSIIFICSFLISCVDIQPLDIGNIDDVKVKSLTDKGVELTMGVTIKNPNNMKFKVKAYDLDVYIDGKKMGKAK